ncbi:hypothetical protein MMC09_001470 [Bachmanniomyces sp. S44760]|nr:hypothetical protein [Bachmanniomyces sp. S44760]
MIFPERRLMVLMRGVCEGVKALHCYRVGGGRGGDARKVRREGERVDREREGEREERKMKKGGRKKGGGHQGEEGVEMESEPLMEGEVMRSQDGIAEGEVRAYAHRDIKPGNIMIADDGTTPILMDLGSMAPSPTPITSRSLALAIQDTAAEHSTMPYRAPELFDVKTGSVIDTKVDIWSLGCTLYACLVGKSPFEARSDETGGSLSICVLGGDWRFPDEAQGKSQQQQKQQQQQQQQKKGKSASVSADGNVNGNGNGAARAAGAGGGISEGVKEVVRRCLKVEAAERPDIDELIEMIEDVIAQLPEDEGEI